MYYKKLLLLWCILLLSCKTNDDIQDESYVDTLFASPPVNKIEFKIKCNYKIKGEEAEQIIDNLMVGRPYITIDNNTNGILCAEFKQQIVYMKLKDGFLDSNIISYLEDGSYGIYPMENNKINGIVKEFYVNGKVKRECIYKDGKINSSEYCYYDDGTLKSTRSQDMYKEFYQSGKLYLEVPYSNGLINGVVKIYDRFFLGSYDYDVVDKADYYRYSLDASISYIDNKRNGKMELYDDGSIWATLMYENDIIVSGVCRYGRKWTEAELINWKNGLFVICNNVQQKDRSL